MISIIIKTNCSHKTYTIVLNICIRLIFRINSSIHSPPSAGSYLVLLYNSGQESIVANIISPCPSDCNFRRLPTLRSCPPEASNLPYLVYYYYSIYRGESVNVSADDAYTPMRRGIPAHNLYRWKPYLAISRCLTIWFMHDAFRSSMFFCRIGEGSCSLTRCPSADLKFNL